jgi:bifunctional DNA-binding transcriptional regulator/antitoxin component of YhaV-PrlF toxin-antitoxin module
MAGITLAADGSIQIPETFREEFHLKEGDRLRIARDSHGRLVVQPERGLDLGRIPGLLRHRAPARPLTVEEMHDAVLDEAVARLVPSNKG